MALLLLWSLAFLVGYVSADAFTGVTVPSTCTDGYSQGTDTVLLTVPYPPAAVIDVVGDFQNLTWSGNDPSTVTLNGTNNEVNTARSYNLQGLSVVETLNQYYRPDLTCVGIPWQPQIQYAPDVAYAEAHTTAEVSYQDDQVYMPFDGLTVSSQCLGNATLLNYTASFCATDVSTTASLLHNLHMQDLQMVQEMLGNSSYTSCEELSTGPCI